MTKKEYLLKVLEKIQKVSPFARGLKLLIEKGNLSDDTINAIQEIVDRQIKEKRLESEQDTLKTASKALGKLKTTEKKLKKKEMEEMDSIIKNIK